MKATTANSMGHVGTVFATSKGVRNFGLATTKEGRSCCGISTMCLAPTRTSPFGRESATAPTSSHIKTLILKIDLPPLVSIESSGTPFTYGARTQHFPSTLGEQCTAVTCKTSPLQPKHNELQSSTSMSSPRSFFLHPHTV